MRIACLSLSFFLVFFSTTASARRLELSEITASSSYPREDGVSYEAQQVGDGKFASSWVEGDQGSGLGSWIEVNFGGEKTVQKAKIWAGLWFSQDYWYRANRPKEVELLFSDGTTQKFSLTDKKEVQELTLQPPPTTSTVRIRVRSIYGGTTWSDTAISEVQFFDAEAGDDIAVRDYSSSTKLPPDADGNYEPSNIADGILDSMWCEGNKGGTGQGEWLEVTFTGEQNVSNLLMINGIGGSIQYWMKGNRAAKATLQFSDGSAEQVVVKNTMLPQTISFPTHKTRSVRVTFDEVLQGKEFNDLCISEANFRE